MAFAAESEERPIKKLKLDNPLPFAETLLTPESISKLSQSYSDSKPYKHAVVAQLFDPAFLSKAREEIVEQISFREKETDIYKVSPSEPLQHMKTDHRM